MVAKHVRAGYGMPRVHQFFFFVRASLGMIPLPVELVLRWACSSKQE